MVSEPYREYPPSACNACGKHLPRGYGCELQNARGEVTGRLCCECKNAMRQQGKTTSGATR